MCEAGGICGRITSLATPTADSVELTLEVTGGQRDAVTIMTLQVKQCAARGEEGSVPLH